MHTQPSHPIHLVADLATALCDLPDAMRVVLVDREGRVIACELMACRIGDALALMMCEEEEYARTTKTDG